ncbi:uncharacterized protein LOC118735854 [Rhagoletis pomonella]|uniref:uncharacterized protein LOC118735854 n=1 Tax=Rhagoletis pomonella TaxID=28610 RepID=UPI001782E534|nr:uncharacterized protein LOC118735854 [Rhagoletis pomonella]
MASFCRIVLLISAFSMLQHVIAQPLAEFNDDSIGSTPKQQQQVDSTSERAPPNKATSPLKREHWAVLCAVIPLTLLLITILKYKCCPSVRICGCKEVELQRRESIPQNRVFKPQHHWGSTNHI